MLREEFLIPIGITPYQLAKKVFAGRCAHDPRLRLI
jgi:hypothetical protein